MARLLITECTYREMTKEEKDSLPFPLRLGENTNFIKITHGKELILIEHDKNNL